MVEIMDDWVQTEPGVCHQVINTGMHGIINGYRDPSFKKILNSADLFAPDGLLVVLIARLRGFPLSKAHTGPDLMWDFGKIADRKGYKYFIYGDTNDTLQTLSIRLRDSFPGLRLVGQYSPPFRELTEEEDQAVMRMIAEAKPDILWVGLGTPKQDRWIFEHRDRLKVPVAVGVGAAFKYHSGILRRAPPLFRNLGLEWLWRLSHEPTRVWRRVFIDTPQFMLLTAIELLGLKKFH